MQRGAAVRELLIYCLEREGAGNQEAGVYPDKAESLERLAGELRGLEDGEPRLPPPGPVLSPDLAG
jgi:hypothetical protein